jgi:Flp pilus assembly secretin CpaC
MSRASFSSLRYRAISWLVAAAAAAIAVSPAIAETIDVIVNQAKVMRIARPADVVIIGNPAIADATIQDSQTLIITGRSFGTTNLIVLDAAGLAIADEIIAVGAQDQNVVTVYRRDSRETFSCNPDCSPTLAVGDSKAWFDSVSEQIQAQIGMTEAASE